MVGHDALNVHFLQFKVEQVDESRLGHGRVSGVPVCGPQKLAKSGALVETSGMPLLLQGRGGWWGWGGWACLPPGKFQLDR